MADIISSSLSLDNPDLELVQSAHLKVHGRTKSMAITFTNSSIENALQYLFCFNKEFHDQSMMLILKEMHETEEGIRVVIGLNRLSPTPPLRGA